MSEVLCDGDPLARQLAALTVAPADIPRDQLMFAAGAASRDRTVSFWRGLALLQTTTLTLLVGVGLSMPELLGNRNPVASQAPPVPQPTQPLPESSPPTRIASREADEVPAKVAHSAQPSFAIQVEVKNLRSDTFAAGIGAISIAATQPEYDLRQLERLFQLPKGVLTFPPRPAEKAIPEHDPENSLDLNH